MEDRIYKLILADGSTLSELRINGNNFISLTPVYPEVFKYNTSTVTIESDDWSQTYQNMELVQITQVNDEYWFVLTEIPENKLEMQSMQSKIDYIMMMTEIE